MSISVPTKVIIPCRISYHAVCAYCGRPFQSYGNPNRKYCSHECYVRDRFWGPDGSPRLRQEENT